MSDKNIDLVELDDLKDVEFDDLTADFEEFEEVPVVEQVEEETYPKQWYVVSTVSGHEQRAATLLAEMAQERKMSAYFGQTLIPTEKVETISGNKVKVTEKKLFPAYLFIEMHMSFDTYDLVRNTPSVRTFVGHDRKSNTLPVPVPQVEMDQIFYKLEENKLAAKQVVKFQVGDTVKLLPKSFEGQKGVVESIDEDNKKVKVIMTMFNSKTTVEFGFEDVAPL